MSAGITALMAEPDDKLEPAVLSYSAFLNRQLLKAWRERLRVHEASANRNEIIGQSLWGSRLWAPRRRHEDTGGS